MGSIHIGNVYTFKFCLLSSLVDEQSFSLLHVNTNQEVQKGKGFYFSKGNFSYL